MRLNGCWSWLLIVATGLLNGCGAGWSQVPVGPAALKREHTVVRATLADGSRVVVSLPRLERDSLVGEVDGTSRAIAMADVQRLALPVASKSKRSAGTAAVIAAIAVFAAGWAYLYLQE